MIKKYILLFIPLLLVSCSLNKPTIDQSFDVTVKSLSMSKIMAEKIAESAIEMHEQGLISDEELGIISEKYEKARLYAEMIIESVESAIELGYLPHEYPNYMTNLEAYSRAISEILTLAQKFGINVTN